jgi:undecaprenyl diphosphate synthase
MDGNGRWAKQRQLPRIAGHRAGLNAVREVIKCCIELQIQVLTLFAFSSENWRRPAQETNHLMELLRVTLQQEIKKLHEKKVQLRFIGDKSKFSDKLTAQMASAEALTSKNKGLKLIIAVDYGGRWDIVEAARQIARQAQAGAIKIDAIDAEWFASHLCSYPLPDPDLFIRTSGEKRISNFLLWQLAYTELYFTETLWPDFTQADFIKALDFYASRQRRFGYSSEQLEGE